MFFTVRPDGGVAAFPEMIVDLADTAGAWFAALPLVWLKGAGIRFSGSNFRFCLWRFPPNPQVDLCSRCPLHLVCHMGVNVQRGAAAVSYTHLHCIAIASMDIQPGEHVHVHNCSSMVRGEQV